MWGDCFFFQAEDGIRDLVRSRGLGDVYKRQYSISSYRDSLNPQIILNEVVIARNNLTTNRLSGYIQNTWQITDTTRLVLTTGIRANYSDLNEQLVISPRVSVTYKPRFSKSLTLRAATGLYYQPPFYRELRGTDGRLYPEVMLSLIHI